MLMLTKNGMNLELFSEGKDNHGMDWWFLHCDYKWNIGPLLPCCMASLNEVFLLLEVIDLFLVYAKHSLGLDLPTIGTGKYMGKWTMWLLCLNQADNITWKDNYMVYEFTVIWFHNYCYRERKGILTSDGMNLELRS